MPGPVRIGGLGGLGGFFEKPLVPTNARIYGQAMLGRRRPITERDFTASELDVIRGLAERSWQKTTHPTGSGSEGNDGVIVIGDGTASADGKAEWTPPSLGAVSYNEYWLPNVDVAPSEDNSHLGRLMERLAAPIVGPEYEDWARTDAMGSVQGTLGQFRATPTADGYRIQDSYDFHPEWEYGDTPTGQMFKDALSGEGDIMGALETAAIRYGPTPGDGIPVDFVVPYDPSSETDRMNKRRFIAEMLRR